MKAVRNTIGALAISAMAVGAQTVSFSATPPHVAATNGCTISSSGAARISYEVSTYDSKKKQWNWTQDRGYVQKVLKQNTLDNSKWFEVPSTSGGEGARIVSATYAQTGTGNWRVQYKNGGTVVASTVVHVNGTC